MLRYLTAGESHGPCLTAIIEGIPAGLALSPGAINRELARRQQGYGRGGRMQIEADTVTILSGVRFGQTLGSPITLQISNRDWENWRDRMAATGQPVGQPVTQPRPGHADLPGALKFRHADIRNVLERASARETAARVAVGAVAKQFLARFGVEIAGYVVAIGSVKANLPPEAPLDFYLAAEQSPVRCPDSAAAAQMMAAIEQAKAEGNTLGGVCEIRAANVPPGLGSHVHWDKRLDGRLAGALMTIQGIKGVEFGLGFAAATLPGAEVHDELFYDPGKGYYRNTNHAGGLEGGITNGETVVVRMAMKPIPTLLKPLRSVDMVTKEPVLASVERSDVCAVPAAAVVGEAVVAFELARAFREKFGGDHMAEITAAYGRYRDYLQGV